MHNSLTIAIDGPSGSGKSTVAKAVAKSLGCAYLDTGAMYRALTWWCLREKIALDDEEAVAREADSFPLDISIDPCNPRVKVGGEDISEAIREPKLSQVVSTVAVNMGVRQAIRKKQRELIFSVPGGCVAEGRDITTVVAPDADLRILLTASPQARLARRSLQTRGSQDDAAMASTRAEVLDRDAMDATVSEFLNPAPGVLLIDSSNMTAAEVVNRVLEIAADARQEIQNAKALKAAISEYDLASEDDLLLQEELLPEDDDDFSGGLPVLAIIGRPNVGKSTFVNRVIGRRVAVVQDQPGVTRDRVSYPAQWAGRSFTLVDTGGWEADVAVIDAAVAQQAEFAIAQSDAVMFIVDATVGITDTDERIVKLLRRCGKPVLLVVNKVDSSIQEADAAAFWALGLGEPWSVSAIHGRGTGDALDAAMNILPTVSSVAPRRPKSGPAKIALVGRPNVGKSSLLNKLAGEQRVVVNELAGTTRDPVDEVLEIDGRPWIFVDTAGIRRRVHQTSGADYYASIRTQGAIEKADLALVLIDASQPLSEQDIRVIGQAQAAGRALVIAMNKWDLVDEYRQETLGREIEKDLVQVYWAPRFNVSAKTGWHTNRLVRAVDSALAGWNTRIPTGRLNAFLGELVAAHPHPVRGGKQPRILFATQASTCPPRFVLFTTGFIEAPYRRFIENRIRETFGFVGTPIEISVRVREKRRK